MCCSNIRGILVVYDLSPTETFASWRPLSVRRARPVGSCNEIRFFKNVTSIGSSFSDLQKIRDRPRFRCRSRSFPEFAWSRWSADLRCRLPASTLAVRWTSVQMAPFAAKSCWACAIWLRFFSWSRPISGQPFVIAGLYLSFLCWASYQCCGRQTRCWLCERALPCLGPYFLELPFAQSLER